MEIMSQPIWLYSRSGCEVMKFEQSLKKQLGFKNAVTCNSGSSANLLAIAALCSPLGNKHLNAGDEVLVPAISWSTTVWPLIQHGLVPVFVDADPRTLNIDTHKLAIATSSKVKIGTYSFYFSHHICTIEGGAALTDHCRLSEIMRIIRGHGWTLESQEIQKEYENRHPELNPRYIFADLGYNVRPTEPMGAMGQIQLEKLHSFVTARRNVADFFEKNIGQSFSKYFSIQHETIGGFHSWFNFSLVLNKDAPFTRMALVEFLNSEGIESRPIIAGNMARQPALKFYKHRISQSLPVADDVMRQGFAIPCHPNVTHIAQKHVVKMFKKFLSQHETST